MNKDVVVSVLETKRNSSLGKHAVTVCSTVSGKVCMLDFGETLI